MSLTRCGIGLFFLTNHINFVNPPPLSLPKQRILMQVFICKNCRKVEMFAILGRQGKYSSIPGGDKRLFSSASLLLFHAYMGLPGDSAVWVCSWALPSSSAEVKNDWSYACMWLYVAQRESFILNVSLWISWELQSSYFVFRRLYRAWHSKWLFWLFIAGLLEELGTHLANRINGFGLNQPQLSLLLCHRLVADNSNL
jgi:hypothetical protein